MSRIENHIILGDLEEKKMDYDIVDGKKSLQWKENQSFQHSLRRVLKYQISARNIMKPRGYFCGIGRCTNCVMTVNGDPNVRTCVTPVEAGMVVETQDGLGKWEEA